MIIYQLSWVWMYGTTQRRVQTSQWILPHFVRDNREDTRVNEKETKQLCGSTPMLSFLFLHFFIVIISKKHFNHAVRPFISDVHLLQMLHHFDCRRLL